MNSMDMDQVMDVPDTPDRLAVCPNTDKSSDNLRDNVVSSRHREKGKELLTFQSFGYQGDNAVVDLTTPNRHVHEFGRNSPYDEALENSQSRIKTKESSNMNGFSCKEWKGKEKIEALENSQSRIKTKESSNMNGFSRKEWKGKEKIEDNVSLPRARGRKRLVRNGFISPHNIVKVKEQAGRESNDLGNKMSNSPSSEIEIRGLIKEDFDSFLMEEKGKGVVRHHRSLVEPGSRPINFSSRSPINNSEKVNITSHARNGLSKQLEGLSGSWRGKRSRTRKKNASLSGSSHAECSTSSFDDGSDVVFLGCSGEPSNGREPSNGTSSRQNNLDQVIEIDEDSPGARHGVSDARARQVEADEMLARELQEQLYNEAPVVGNEEQMDALMASALHQEDSQNGLFGGNGISTGLTIWEIYRQSLNDSSTMRRGRPSRVPGHSRISRLRNRLARHPYRVTSQRNSVFPTTMDVDTRMRILETLEELSDMGVGGNFLPVQRDFNENDYEMLLALDENNHQHVGASNDQINGLPQSIVQSDNFEEACVICLEKPTTGDTVRHLPCLHKFHKDCIDPWLRRRTSCPVCKSSIT